MEIILSPNDGRIRILKQKAALIEAALIDKNLSCEISVFTSQYNWSVLQYNLTARGCQTIARALEIWYQDFVS